MSGQTGLCLVVGLAAEARIARPLGRVGIGGGTATGAVLAAERLVAEGAAALLSFGLAGGLDPALPAGAVVVPREVQAGDVIFPTDPDLTAWLGGATAGRLLGGEDVIADAAAKRRLHEATGAAAIDLESGAVARAAAVHHLPFAVLRAVCDPAGRSLPPAAVIALDHTGAVGLLPMLAAIIVRPGQIPALLALAADAAAARRALLRRVGELRLRAPAV